MNIEQIMHAGIKKSVMGNFERFTAKLGRIPKPFKSR
jgi:hypothetical protein